MTEHGPDPPPLCVCGGGGGLREKQAGPTQDIADGL